MYQQKQVQILFDLETKTTEKTLLFVRLDFHEVFIRTENNLLEICPIRIMSFTADANTFDPVLRVQVKEILEHTFDGVLDKNDQLQIEITGTIKSNRLIESMKTFFFYLFLDPFDRPLPFKRFPNERGELTIALSPVRVGQFSLEFRLVLILFVSFRNSLDACLEQ